jgi:AraC-like DNA-binding protein
LSTASEPRPSANGVRQGSADPRIEPLKGLFQRLNDPGVFSEYCEYPDRSLYGARLRLLGSIGEGHWDMLRMGDSLYVMIGNATYHKPGVVPVPSEGLMSFHVRLTGDVDLHLDQRNCLRITGPSLLVWHQPPGAVSLEEERTRKRVEFVTLYCDPSVIAGALGDNAGSVSQRMAGFLQSLGRGTHYYYLPIDAEIIASARALCRSRFSGRLRLLHYEAKVLELLCLILAAADRLADFVADHYGEADLRRLQRARDILGTEFNPVPQTASLARRLGINETKLKRGFKALYGHPLHEFANNCRMQHALQLLRDRHLMVRHVAAEVGYTHQTTFANSFKRHFGYRPKDVRRAPVVEASGPASRARHNGR